MERIPVIKPSVEPAVDHPDQPAWQMVEQLKRRSHFRRATQISPDTWIEGEKKFRIEVIRSGQDPTLTAVHKMFERTFGEEEVDPEEFLRTAVEGITPWGTPDSRYLILTAKNEKGKLISTITGAQLDIEDEQGQLTGETVLYIGYAVTDPKIRQGGLARELYISMVMEAAQQAQREGKRLKFAIGECTWTSEKFWNKVGWKRVYTQTGGKKEYTELPYVQPALDYDPATGAPTEEAGEMPEHLMVDAFGNAVPNKTDLQRAVQSLYYFCNEWPPEAFTTPGAFEQQQVYLAGIRTDLKKFLDDSGQLILLDAEKREQALQVGLIIHEHQAANQGNTGEEDF